MPIGEKHAVKFAYVMVQKAGIQSYAPFIAFKIVVYGQSAEIAVFGTANLIFILAKRHAQAAESGKLKSVALIVFIGSLPRGVLRPGKAAKHNRQYH
ncbi:hypothetical protein D3C87_1660960 [compost metagenome]